MKILIIGGTKFLGRHLVTAAIERNHSVTLFNRGVTSVGEVAGVELIQGDRNVDLDRLEGREFDTVIDTCGYLPEAMRVSSEALKDRIGLYIFVSSISAYADFSTPNFDESFPVARLDPEQEAKIAEIDLKSSLRSDDLGKMYGPLKALCEETVEEIIPGRVCIIRPGLIVGKYDNTDRFTYWVERVAKGGEILAPGDPNQFIQFIDAHDLAKWTIKMTEEKVRGIFNATGRPNEITMEGLLEGIKVAAKSDAEFRWVSEEFLSSENVAPWGEMPLYLPESDESLQGFLSANIDKALDKGLKFRPLSETVADILEWRKSNNSALKAGISAERESELLSKWHSR